MLSSFFRSVANLFFFVLILFTFSVGSANGVGNPDKRNTLLIIHSDYCPHCRNLINDFVNNPSIDNYIEDLNLKKIVIYDVAKLQEKKEVVDLVKLGKIKEISAIPAVLFVDDDFYEAKPSCRIEGYANFDDFMLTLKKNNGLSFCSP